MSRCTASGATKTHERGYCHAWNLHMPCGRFVRSRAAEPPITVSCRKPCPVDPTTHNRRRLPVHEW